MGIEAIHYRRRFDWFNLLYPIVPVIFLYGILRAADANPVELPWFWIVLGLIALSQIIYFIFAARSPDQLHLDDDNLVARWSSKCREVSIPRIEVRIRKSYLFTGGYEFHLAVSPSSFSRGTSREGNWSRNY